jgi:hypothetical protein
VDRGGANRRLTASYNVSALIRKNHALED